MRYVDPHTQFDSVPQPPEDGVDASWAQLVARLFREHDNAPVSLWALQLRSQHDAKEVAQGA